MDVVEGHHPKYVNTETKITNTTGSNLQVGAKYWVHMDTNMGTIDTRNSEREEGEKGRRTEKLLIRYYVHYLGDETNQTPNLSIIQYTNITNLYTDPLNLK